MVDIHGSMTFFQLARLSPLSLDTVFKWIKEAVEEKSPVMSFVSHGPIETDDSTRHTKESKDTATLLVGYVGCVAEASTTWFIRAYCDIF